MNSNKRQRIWLSTVLLVSTSLLVGSVYSREIGKPIDGSGLFAEHCVRCHGLGVIAPNIAQMSKMTYDEIYQELWYGLMAKVAVGLEDADRKALARYISDLNSDKSPRTSGATMCTGGGPGEVAEATTANGPDGPRRLTTPATFRVYKLI